MSEQTPTPPPRPTIKAPSKSHQKAAASSSFQGKEKKKRHRKKKETMSDYIQSKRDQKNNSNKRARTTSPLVVTQPEADGSIEEVVVNASQPTSLLTENTGEEHRLSSSLSSFLAVVTQSQQHGSAVTSPLPLSPPTDYVTTMTDTTTVPPTLSVNSIVIPTAPPKPPASCPIIKRNARVTADKNIVINCDKLIVSCRDSLPLGGALRTGYSLQKDIRHLFDPPPYKPRAKKSTNNSNTPASGQKMVTDGDKKKTPKSTRPRRKQSPTSNEATPSTKGSPIPPATTKPSTLPRPVSGIVGLSHHRRLILEDLLIVLPSATQPYLLLVRNDHPDLPMFRLAQSRVHIPMLPDYLIHNKTFLQLPVYVTHNPKRSVFMEGGLHPTEFDQVVFGNGNEGFGFKFVGDPVSDELIFPFKLFLTSDLQFWGALGHSRQFKPALRSKSNAVARKRLFSRLAYELDGDVASLAHLYNAYNSFNTPKEKPAPDVNELFLLDSLDIEIAGPILQETSDAVDAIILPQLQECYGSFISWSDPILRQEDLQAIQDMVFDRFPVQIEFLRQACGFDYKVNQVRSEHLESYYDRAILFQFFAIARVRNDQVFVLWALISTAVYYGASHRGAANRIPVFYGLSCAFKTLMLRTKELCEPEAYFGRVDKEVEEAGWVEFLSDDAVTCRTFVAIGYFDNSQKNTTYNFQRGGRSGSMVRLTSRALEKPWFGNWKSGGVHVPGKVSTILSFVDQNVPSPIGMYAYETLLVANHLLPPLANRALLDPTLLPSENIPDPTGDRVRGYIKAVFMAENLKLLYRHFSRQHSYTFRPQCYDDSPTMSAIATILNKRRGKDKLMFRASTFLRASVVQYRGQRPKAYINCLPAMKDDEVTIDGMLKVLSKMLLRCRLIRANEKGKFPEYLAIKGADPRYAIIAADGLSHERWRQVENRLLDIQDNSINYKQHYEQCAELRSALKNVFLVVGDLHAALFHTLGPVYTIAYGGFLQPLQLALGWKRIQFTKIEKCYRQASALVIMILFRVEARLMEEMVSQMDPDEVQALIMMQTKEKDHASILESTLSWRFDAWLEEKLESTKDKWFQFVLNFVRVSRDYRLLRDGISSGADILVEFILNRFLEIWVVVGKHKCLEVGLRSMEDLYKTSPYPLLQVYRDNCFSKLFDSNCLDGSETSHRALDEKMEVFQHKYKQMPFKNDLLAWLKHSYNMPAVQKSTTFVEGAMVRRADVESMKEFEAGKMADGSSTDVGGRKKQTFPSKRACEKRVIDEILTLSGVCREDETRTQLDPNLLWDVLPKLTAILDQKKEAKDKEGNVVGEEEQLDSGDELECEDERRLCGIFTDDREKQMIAGNLSAGTLAEQLGSEIDVVGNEAEETEEAMELNNVLAQNEDDTEVEAVVNGRAANSTAAVMLDTGSQGKGGKHTIVIGGQKRKLQSVIKVPVYEHATKNMYSLGRAKLVEMNLPAMRIRRKLRMERNYKGLHESLYIFQQEMGGDIEITKTNFRLLADGPTSDVRRLAANIGI